jgi:hypothetical protein
MIATSIMLIAWMMGFLFIFSGLEKSQQMQDGVLTVARDRQLAFGVGLVAYVGVTMTIGMTFLI